MRFSNEHNYTPDPFVDYISIFDAFFTRYNGPTGRASH